MFNTLWRDVQNSFPQAKICCWPVVQHLWKYMSVSKAFTRPDLAQSLHIKIELTAEVKRWLVAPCCAAPLTEAAD